jgi:hypothetical protein
MKDDETRDRVVAVKKQALDEELDKFLAEKAKGEDPVLETEAAVEDKAE